MEGFGPRPTLHFTVYCLLLSPFRATADTQLVVLFTCRSYMSRRAPRTALDSREDHTHQEIPPHTRPDTTVESVESHSHAKTQIFPTKHTPALLGKRWHPAHPRMYRCRPAAAAPLTLPISPFHTRCWHTHPGAIGRGSRRLRAFPSAHLVCYVHVPSPPYRTSRAPSSLG